MGKESGTQFLKALKDAIGESAIDGEARRGVEREQEARIEADNELSAAIDDEKEARIAEESDLRDEIEKSVQYGGEWQFTKLPDGIEATWVHTLGPQFNSGVACRLTAKQSIAAGEHECALSLAGFAPKTYTRAGIAADTIVWGSHAAGGAEIKDFTFEQTKDAAIASFTVSVNDGMEAGSVLYVTLEDGVSDQLLDTVASYSDEWTVSGLADGLELEYCHGIGAKYVSSVVCKLNVAQTGRYGTYTITFQPPEGNYSRYALSANLVRIVGTQNYPYHSTFELIDYGWDYDACNGTLEIEDTLDAGAEIYISLMPSAVGDGSVTSDKLKASCVTQDKIGSYSVITGKLADKAVTTAKIANNAVGTDQLGYGVVTKAKMAEASVGTEELSDGCVTKAKLSSSLGFVATPSTSVSLKANESKTVVLATNATITDGSWAHIVNTYGLDDATTASVAFGTYAVGSTRVTVHVANNTDSAISFNIRVFLLKDTLFE